MVIFILVLITLAIVGEEIDLISKEIAVYSISLAIFAMGVIPLIEAISLFFHKTRDFISIVGCIAIACLLFSIGYFSIPNKSPSAEELLIIIPLIIISLLVIIAIGFMSVIRGLR